MLVSVELIRLQVRGWVVYLILPAIFGVYLCNAFFRFFPSFGVSCVVPSCSRNAMCLHPCLTTESIGMFLGLGFLGPLPPTGLVFFESLIVLLVFEGSGSNMYVSIISPFLLRRHDVEWLQILSVFLILAIFNAIF